jgi:hypothetical protein
MQKRPMWSQSVANWQATAVATSYASAECLLLTVMTQLSATLGSLEGRA